MLQHEDTSRKRKLRVMLMCLLMYKYALHLMKTAQKYFVSEEHCPTKSSTSYLLSISSVFGHHLSQRL